MEPNEQRRLDLISKAISRMIRGECPDQIDVAGYPDDEIRQVTEFINKFSQLFKEFTEATIKLGHGDLSFKPNPKNYLLSPIKSLQSNLLHLTWQAQEIANGDFNQHVDFMGDFSVAFNRMIEKLRVVEDGIQEKERKRFLDVAKISHSWIWETDTEGNLTYSSDMIEEVLGYTAEDMIGQSMFRLLPPEDHNLYINAIRRMVDTQSPVQSLQIMNRRINGVLIPVEINIMPVFDQDGLWIECRGVTNDISMRRQYEQELIVAREKAESASKVKSQLLANASHEMRTPLNAIIGFAEICRKDCSPVNQAEYLQLIESESEQLLHLINNLLDLGKMEAEKLDIESNPLEIKSLIQEVSAVAKSKIGDKDIHFNVQSELDVPDTIMGDVVRIRQILTNLLDNAVKFTDSGEIVFRIRPDRPHFDTPRVRFEIEDTGIGIPDDKQDAIFEAFVQADSSTTRQYGGTGLGMTIVKNLVQHMNGSMDLWSRSGIGTRIAISLPAALPPVLDESDVKRNPAGEMHPELADKSILIVEDYQTNRTVAGIFLEKTGISVEFANDGQEGVDRANFKLYDLILMDLHMPIMDGFESARQIRSGSGMNRDTHIIALTANVSPSTLKACHEWPFDGVITKPIRRESFTASIVKYLQKAYSTV